MFTFLTKDLITDEKRDTSKIVKIKTLYWNRTNIYCFEDRCTNHYTKSANKVFFYIICTSEET